MNESSAISESDAAAYCAARVRRFDRDRWLATLFAPADHRDALMALYAFNLEIATARESVSETMLGRIRLQWWREALDGIYGGAPRRHAVALALTRAVERCRLDRADIQAMIEAREFDMEDRPPENFAALEDYAAGSSGALCRLALAALGADSESARRAGLHGGIAWALTGLLRAVPFHAAQRRCYLPQDWIAEAGTRASRLFEMKEDDRLSTVARRVAAVARDHLAAARALRSAVPRTALAALLPLTVAEGVLDRMEGNGFRLFTNGGPGPLARQTRLTLAALRGRY